MKFKLLRHWHMFWAVWDFLKLHISPSGAHNLEIQPAFAPRNTVKQSENPRITPAAAVAQIRYIIHMQIRQPTLQFFDFFNRPFKFQFRVFPALLHLTQRIVMLGFTHRCGWHNIEYDYSTRQSLPKLAKNAFTSANPKYINTPSNTSKTGFPCAATRAIHSSSNIEVPR